MLVNLPWGPPLNPTLTVPPSPATLEDMVPLLSAAPYLGCTPGTIPGPTPWPSIGCNLVWTLSLVFSGPSPGCTPGPTLTNPWTRPWTPLPHPWSPRPPLTVPQSAGARAGGDVPSSGAESNFHSTRKCAASFISLSNDFQRFFKMSISGFRTGNVSFRAEQAKLRTRARCVRHVITSSCAQAQATCIALDRAGVVGMFSFEDATQSVHNPPGIITAKRDAGARVGRNKM